MQHMSQNASICNILGTGKTVTFKHAYVPQLGCCGINGYTDWDSVVPPTIPNSCCSVREITGTVTTACTKDSEFLHKSGCITKLVSHMQDIAYVLGGVGLGIAFVQVCIQQINYTY